MLKSFRLVAKKDKFSLLIVTTFITKDLTASKSAAELELLFTKRVVGHE